LQSVAAPRTANSTGDFFVRSHFPFWTCVIFKLALFGFM